MATETYKAHRIDARLLASGSDRWRVEVYVWSITELQIRRVKLPPPPSEWAASTKKEAEAWGLTQGRMWIDLLA